MVVEGQPGGGYGAFMPDFPGRFAFGGTVRQIKLLIKEAVKDELECLKEENKSAPKPKKRNCLALRKLVHSIDTPEKVQLVPIVLDMPIEQEATDALLANAWVHCGR